MASDDSTTTTLLAPLETHVKAQVQHLTAVARVVRELHSTEQQYATEYAELPVGVPESAKLPLERLPQLREACDSFGLFARKCSTIKAAVAQDLAKEVIAPLEAFTADHAEKAQHLLSELYELLQREKAFDLGYENLREGCKEDQTGAVKSSQDESELQLRQAHMEQLLRKRDAERLAIEQWITALHFAGQRYEAHARDVLRQTIAVYSRMIDSMTALVGEFQEQRLSQEIDVANVAIVGASDNNSDVATEEAWESFLAGYECHVTMTCWMSELFKQMIPAEHKTAKCLHESAKLDRAVCMSFERVGLGAPLSGLIQFHGLLTVNIANPIIRTLKFSRARQERMRNELSRTLDETRMLVGSARTRLEASGPKSKAAEETPVRCDSLTSSETSDCSLAESNESEQNTIDVAPQEQASVESSPEQLHLETMERKLALQKQEMSRALEQTSFLAVKTMELMVQDHVKHVTKALASLKEAMLPQTQRRKSDAAKQPWKHIAERLSIKVSDQRELQGPVDQLIERQPRFENQENSVAIYPPVARRRRKNRTGGCGVREPSAVQVALSFLQSAVGVVYWAAGTGFKAVKTHMPHSFEERVVLVFVVTAILMLVSVCVKSSAMQSSWSELTYAQHTNSENLVQIVKLSLEVCGQQVAAIPTRTEGSSSS